MRHLQKTEHKRTKQTNRRRHFIKKETGSRKSAYANQKNRSFVRSFVGYICVCVRGICHVCCCASEAFEKGMSLKNRERQHYYHHCTVSQKTVIIS
mmetsp:Transcript_19940/g.30302  ORF Transcript_19940/g.30302 Transcript_19940/m.30302 type:complete len:96 (+) Transcript_19940:313-600(+)